MKAYAVDLRERVVAAVEAGMSKPEVAKVFGVSIPTIYRYLRLREEREDGKLDPKAITGRPSRKGAALDAGLLLQLEANKDATLGEHCGVNPIYRTSMQVNFSVSAASNSTGGR